MILKTMYQLAGFLYVDDTNLVALNIRDESVDTIVTRVQILVDRWQYTLQLIGRELKYSKCFWMLQSYS